MQLTDEDRAAMLLLLEQNKDPYAFYIAGVRAGMKRAEEKIARLQAELDDVPYRRED